MVVATQSGDVVQPRLHKMPHILLGGAAVEGLGGLAGVVLAIIGLAGIYPGYMLPIATIAIGAAFVFEGTAVATRYNRLIRAANADEVQRVELSGGTTAEFLGGAAGIVLGILALLDIEGPTMMASAAIVFGATLLVSAGAISQFESLRTSSQHPHLQEVIDDSIKVASGAQVMAGIAAIVLGILALVGSENMVFALIALLVVGAAQLIIGSAVTAKMTEAFRTAPSV